MDKKASTDRRSIRVLSMVLETLMSGQSLCFHSTDEDGNIENFCFYWRDGQLYQDSDKRYLNNDGVRYLAESFEGEESSFEDIVYILRESRDLNWSLGWSNADCAL